ncbi:MAG: TldD/PmbA family protein [Acidobacteriota bacterium]
MHEQDELLDRGLQVLRDTKAGQGEIYVEERTVFRAGVAAGAVESLETQEVRGAGLRLFHDGRVAFGYTADLSVEGLARAAAMISDLLTVTEVDEARCLPEMDESSSPEPDCYDASLARVDPQDKLSLARRVEETARAQDERIKKVHRSQYTDVIGRVGIAATGGLRRCWSFSRVYASIEVVAEQGGESQSGFNEEFAVRFSALDPMHVGREAVRRALQKLGAERTETRRANLVLDPVVTASLLEAIAPALCADNVLKGKSVLATRVGREVAGPRVTLLDDGRHPCGDRSASYDGEGVATRCTLLIEGGVLKGFLHSSDTSIRMGTAPTGNTYRASFRSPPRIAPSTLYLESSGVSRDDLLREAGDGLCITEVMGLHTIDAVSGDVSLGASGYSLASGRPGKPVDRIGIAGNLLDLLRSIRAVATDRKFFPGSSAGSSTLLAGISVSGT